MARKVYSYPGIASGDILIKVGLKGHIRVPFTNGYLDKKMKRPAIYATSDPVMQEIIENSVLFNHRIFLKKNYGEDAEPQTGPAGTSATDGIGDDDNSAESAGENTETAYPDVTTWEEAVRVLKSIPGVKVTSLRTPASAKKVAALKGVIFPNYNFE